MTSATTCPIRKHPDSGLLYTLRGGEAVIVGCTVMNLTHLEIPPVITDGAAQYRVTAIGESAFGCMSSLRTVSLPDTLTRIGHGAFEASGLTELRLPTSLTAVAPYAFCRCAHLVHVDLPASGSLTLPEQAFGGCSALTRSGVTNLHFLSNEDIRRSGLPQQPAPAAPTIVWAGGGAPGGSSVQGLLQQGRQLEEEQRSVEAAAYYLRAHRLREAAGRNPDLQGQLADLNAVTEAEYRLGVLLKLGLAPLKDPDGSDRPSAAELLRTAADTGSIADAAYHLGDLYAGGYGVQADPAEALRYLRQAAALGHERACLDLGYAYLDGTLGPVKPDAALLFFTKCAACSGPYAAIARQEVAGLSPRS